MRELTTFQNKTDAHVLSDYLLTQGIASRVEAESDGWVLWIRDEDDLNRAKWELDRYVRNPDHPRYVESQVIARKIRQEVRHAEKEQEKRFIDARTLWERPPPSRTVLTIALIAVSVAVTVLTSFGDSAFGWRWLAISDVVRQNRAGGGWLITYHGMQPILNGQVWRLITPIFLHLGVIHLLFNMLFLYQVGGRLEAVRGTWRFALLVLVSACASNLAEYWWSGPFFGGMSGVLYAVFGYTWAKSRLSPEAGLFMPSSTIVILLVWLVVCMTGLLGPVGNAAHVTGLLVGLVSGSAAWLWRKLVRKKR